MHGVINSLRSGDWLTRERMRLVAFAVLFASLVGLIAIVARSDGYLDARGHPIGTDFANVYAAGTYVLEGRPEAPFDPAIHHARQQEIFGAKHAVLRLALSAVLPVHRGRARAAALRGRAGGLGHDHLPALSLLDPRDPAPAETPPNASADASTIDPLWLLFAAAFPAVLVNAGHGQNGFLTAALIGGALVMLDRRPAFAGILFGALSYKPQFGLMIPLVLIATQRWRAFGVAVVTVAALAAVTTVAFGPSVWSAFLASTEFSRVVVLEAGGTGWHKIQSVFSWVRMWGGSVAVAYAIHAAVVIVLGVMLVRLWRSDRPYPLKAGALIIASVLSTPYALDYDMMALAPAIAFLAVDGMQRGFSAWQKTALAALWLAPIAARSVAEYAFLPIGVWAMIAALILFVRGAPAAQPLAAQSRTNSRAL